MQALSASLLAPRAALPPTAPPTRASLHNHTQILSSASAGGGVEASLDVEAVEAQLRGVLLKLQYADAYLKRLPQGCTFAVAAYTSAGRAGAGALPQAAWVEEQPRAGQSLELAQARAASGESRRRGMPACTS